MSASARLSPPTARAARATPSAARRDRHHRHLGSCALVVGACPILFFIVLRLPRPAPDARPRACARELHRRDLRRLVPDAPVTAHRPQPLRPTSARHTRPAPATRPPSARHRPSRRAPREPALPST